MDDLDVDELDLPPPYSTRSATPTLSLTQRFSAPDLALANPTINTNSINGDAETVEDLDAIKHLPPLRESTPPAPLPFCPEGTLTTRAIWYEAAGRRVAMCSVCYNKYVAGTPLASRFVARERARGVCAFWTPAVRALLRAQDARAIPAVQLRAAVPSCPGGKWYMAHGVRFCEACFLDNVAGRPWASAFTLVAADPTCACTLAMPYARRALFQLIAEHPRAHTDALEAWADAVAVRAALPGCAGRGRRDTQWWPPSGAYAVPGVAICKACYLDHFAYTRFGPGFAALPSGPPSCTLRDHAFRLATILEGEHGDLERWHARATAIMVANRADTMQMYTLRGPAVPFAVCDKCAHARFAPYGALRFLSPSPSEAVCDMCGAGAPRADRAAGVGRFRSAALFARLADAALLGLWAHFDAHVALLTSLPACRERAGGRGTWYGWRDLPACSGCWASFGAHTALARRAAPSRGGEDMCALYSPRMRAALENAADDEEALSALLAMGRARAEKWERCCVPWLEYRARVAAGRAGRGEAAVAELIREWEEVE